jgi:hypothetical protein
MISFLLCLSLAWADGPAEESLQESTEELPVVEEDTEEEMIIEEDLQVERARAQLDRRMRDLGYKEGKDKGDRVIYRPETSWKPSVVVHDEAFVIIRRTPPRFEPWVKSRAPIAYLSCIPPFTPMCLRVQGVLVSKRRLQHHKTNVTESIEPMVYTWREAIVDRAMKFRVEEELPGILDAVWYEGRPLDSREPLLADAASRRSEILTLWSSRTCTPEGDQVRAVVADYLVWEVQRSQTPANEAEIAEANEACPCTARLPWPLEDSGSEP